MSKPETIADLLDELRSGEYAPLADRIEAAVRRECKSPSCPTHKMTLEEAIAHAEECADDTPCGRQHKQLADWLKELRSIKALGNVQKMRKALVWLRENGYRSPEGGWMCITLKMTHKDGNPHPVEVPPYADDVIDAALSALPRNCDVGTEEKQYERFRAFCDKYDKDCTGCPCDGLTCSLAYCFAKWAQMPYVEKEG